MAPERSFDYELLKRLYRDHPEMSYHEYAKILSEDNWTRDPHAPAVLSNTIARAISVWAPRWAAEGIVVHDKRVPVYRELIPERWRIAAHHKNDVILRKLRTTAALRRGLEASQRDERQARQFERTLRENCQVVDVTRAGRPIIRPASPWELDASGQLIDIVARLKPDDWKDLDETS